MKGTIIVNQKFALALGLDITDACLFDFLRGHLVAHMREEGGALLDIKWIGEGMPILQLSEKSMKQRLEKLEEVGLIRLRKIKGGYLVDIGDNGRRYDFEEPIAVKKEEKKPKETASLLERELRFKNECDSFASAYTPKMVGEFFSYWSEPNKSKTKMRFEQEPTWETSRRMATWARRNNVRAIRNLSVFDAFDKAYGK